MPSILAERHHHLDDDESPDHHRPDDAKIQRRYRALGLAGCVSLVLLATFAATPGFNGDNLRGDFGVLSADGSAASVFVDSSGAMNSTRESGVRHVSFGIGCPEFQLAFDSATPGSSLPFRSFTLTKGSGYAYVALHLSKLWMPRGTSVVLRAVEGFDTPDRTLNLSMNYPSGKAYSKVLAAPLLSKEFRLEFYRNAGSPNTTEDDIAVDSFNVTDTETKCFGFVVDWYRYVLMDLSNPIVATDESICAADNTKEAICYYGDPTTRTSFLASRAVARLLIPKGDGASAGCTGWLLGNQGHMITNYHCVATDEDAANTAVEFMAGADVCSDSVTCTYWGACPGITVTVSVELVHADEDLDYALIKMPADGPLIAETYGYLRLKSRPGVVGEQIYIPQHPLYHGKRIAMVDDYTNFVALLGLSASSCGSIGYSYSGDTQSGSSGSPVISFADHGVVALHHCGEMCSNTGIPAMNIVADLAKNGVDVSAFDGLDDGSDPAANAERFPAYVPPPPVEALPLISRLMINGAIILASGSVSIDTVAFKLKSDTNVIFDVRSVEIADNDTFYDLNGDCHSTYLDSMIYLFPKGGVDPIFMVDDCQLNVGGDDDGSISYRDPFKSTYLKKGEYILVIAPTGASEQDALAGKTKADYPPELYTCRARGSYGSYKLLISSTAGDDPFVFTSLPAAVAINPGMCTKKADAICSEYR